MKKKKWLLAADHNPCAEQLAGELGLGRLTARVLAARGLDTREKALDFMTQSVEGIHDPFLLKDMDGGDPPGHRPGGQDRRLWGL